MARAPCDLCESANAGRCLVAQSGSDETGVCPCDCHAGSSCYFVLVYRPHSKSEACEWPVRSSYGEGFGEGKPVAVLPRAELERLIELAIAGGCRRLDRLGTTCETGCRCDLGALLTRIMG